MKILAIRGRNLASLEDEFNIDFTVEPLLSAGIFAISGSTGSGKSTLLDAMCLALFSKTPRTNQARENNVKVKDINDDTLIQSDPRFLLRRGAASGYAEVDFLALNGHRYRARWSIARAREKAGGRLQNYQVSLFNLDAGAEEQGKRTELQTRIIELTGLTFDQFTRSVLLAQNDFATFLRAEQTEKASLLEKLTGTEHYSAISRLIFEKNNEAKEAYEKVRLTIEGIELLPDEKEAELCENLDETEKRLQHLEKLNREHQRLSDAIKSAEQTINHKQEEQKKANEKLDKATALLETSRKSYEEAHLKYQTLETAYANLLPEIRQAQKLDIQLKAEKKTLDEARVSLENASKEQTENERKRKQLLEKQQKIAHEIACIATWIDAHEPKEKIAEQLSVLLLHLDNAANALSAKEKAEKNRQKLKKQANDLQAEIEKLDPSKEYTDETQIKKAIENCRQQREKRIVEQTRFATSGNVKSLRDKLAEGIPCPVCGSLEHPYASAQVIDYFVKVGNEIVLLEKKIAHLNQVAAWVSEKKKVAELLPHDDNEIEKQETLLNHSLSAANQLFGNASWQAHWKQDSPGFRQKLIAFSGEWNKNKEALLQLRQSQKITEQEYKTYESFSDALCKRVQEAQTSYHEKCAALERRQAERSRLLEGKATEAVEKGFTQQIESLKKQWEDLRKTQTEQSGIAEQSKGALEQISQDLVNASKELTRHQESFDKWLDQYNRLEGAEPLAARLSQTMQQKSDYVFRLRKQKESKQKTAALQNELDTTRTISERWGKLNDLAGSSDGAKFRRIAQGYTLDVLLSYANVQLHHLSHRYRLERVPETLALQVVDRDMCDEIRTVHSLSGGESFLVSLALALGLSSLSSNRMKVESLFIDEGFGSLDADTLRIALDALESLRTQGRKIGVISHVQEMTERIPVQIKVIPTGNGRSRIDY
ncbi:MAG: AAA family ATPase [Tannerellaceae bacterium]|jgi:exonuclease SbcC|nr:AAA family ATPase [Tannerellaceae bacterium]